MVDPNDMIEKLLDMPIHNFTAKELQFLQDVDEILQAENTISEPQAEWLTDLYRRETGDFET